MKVGTNETPTSTICSNQLEEVKKQALALRNTDDSLPNADSACVILNWGPAAH